MNLKPKHREIRVVEKRLIFPYSLGSYESKWFEKVKIKQMYLEYDDFLEYGLTVAL